MFSGSVPRSNSVMLDGGEEPFLGTRTNNWILALSLLLDAIGHKEVDILSFIQQQHGSQVPNALVCELLGGNQFEALKLQEKGRRSQPMKPPPPVIQVDRTKGWLKRTCQESTRQPTRCYRAQQSNM